MLTGLHAVLQDNVPPFDSDQARAILEASLGKKVEEVFTEFGEAPIAAASLGQVKNSGGTDAHLRDVTLCT